MFQKRFLFAVIALVIAAWAMAPLSLAQDAEISLVLNKQTPYPVEPGQVLNIEVSLLNNGTGSKSLTLEIVPKEPFTLLPGQELRKTFSRVNAFDSVTQTYQLKVAESAVSATYEIEFRYYREGVGAYVQKMIPVSVQGTPKFVISDVETVPERIQPGDEVEIRMVISNEGTGHATQTELSLEPIADTATGTSIIVPLLSGGVSYLGRIDPGAVSTAVFRMKVENDAEYKTYKSTLTIGYKDENGEPGTVTYDIGIPVNGRPLLDILNTELDAGEFKVELTNLGTADAKGIKIALLQGEGNNGVSVVSEIKAGKYKAVRFSGFSYGAGKLNISYYDESNALHSTETDIYIDRPLVTGSEGSVAAPLIYVLGAAVILETIYIFRLRKRKK